jgi:hypothetical protein
MKRIILFGASALAVLALRAADLSLGWYHEDTAYNIEAAGTGKPMRTNAAAAFRVYWTKDNEAFQNIFIDPAAYYGPLTNPLTGVSTGTNIFYYTFTNMPPANYRFTVTSVNVWGQESTKPTNVFGPSTNMPTIPTIQSVFVKVR